MIAFVLAGGASRRFGSDKLVAIVDGSESVARVVRSLRAAGVGLVYLVVREEWQCKVYSQVARPDGCLLDEPIQPAGCVGPAAAIYTALRLAVLLGEEVLVVPGDMPWLGSYELRRLVDLGLGAAPAATIVHEGGWLESLIHLYVSEAVYYSVEGLSRWCKVRGYARPTDALRSQPRLALVGSALLSYTATSFTHINTQEALRTREPRSKLAHSLLTIERRHPLPPQELGSLCKWILEEARTYEEHGVTHLREQALNDAKTLCAEADL
jgi:molybdopterin-guanine dinucleotide biosynthesis protein A